MLSAVTANFWFMLHPWRLLRERDDLTLSVRDLGDDGPLGLTDGSTIILTTGLLQVERRCVLLHELIHLERGIPHSADVREEAAIEREVARRLIPLCELVDALRWSREVEEIAEACWVMPHLIPIRMQNLHPAELSAVREVLRHHHVA